MTGSGNDFVMLDGRLSAPEDWSADDVRAVCARGTGIGADGVVFLSPGADAQAVRMIYLNSDGSRAAMCGNAALCSVQLANRLGLAAGPLRLETDSGSYQGRPAEGPRAELGFPAVDPPNDLPDLIRGAAEERAALVSVGVPHVIVAVADVEQVDVVVRGAELRHDPALGAGGANVNFLSRSTAPAGWRIRTYERGVEGETLACGTGAAAAACTLESWGLAPFPVTLITRSGRCIDVHARKLPSGQYDNVSLTGEARLVFRGVLG